MERRDAEVGREQKELLDGLIAGLVLFRNAIQSPDQVQRLQISATVLPSLHGIRQEHFPMMELTAEPVPGRFEGLRPYDVSAVWRKSGSEG